MSDLFTDNGNRAGIYEVCQWWLQRYPADVFPYTKCGRSHMVAVVRHEMEAVVAAEAAGKHRRRKESLDQD